MATVHRTEFGLDTGMFSVHQMHPEIALRLAGSAALAGLAESKCSLQSMITDHHTAVVVMWCEVRYPRPLTFFSASAVTTTAEVRLREDGKLLLFEMAHCVDRQEAVCTRVAVRPVKLTGGPALDAGTGALDGDLRERFGPHEPVPDNTAPTRFLQAEIDRWTADAEPIAEDRRSLFIARNDAELADQWLYSRLPSFVATAREELLFDGASELAVAVQRPIVSFQGEYYRPMYFGDRGLIQVRAFRAGERTVLVHRVLGALVPGADEGARPLCAQALEVF